MVNMLEDDESEISPNVKDVIREIIHVPNGADAEIPTFYV